MKLLLTLLAISFSFASQATQIIEWNKKPIRVVLPVGKERIIQLEDNAYVGVPESIKPLLRVQSAQGSVYLTAIEEFPESRLQIKLNATGEILLIDIKTSVKNTETENVIIKTSKAKRPSEDKNNSNQDIAINKRDPVTPIQLTRFASRAFFGPERLSVKDSRIKMTQAPDIPLSNLFNGSSYGLFAMEALAVFRANNMYLTAIKITNKTPVPQVIKFREIDADFQFATPQHLRVNQANVAGDMTVLYIITDKPLSAAIYMPYSRINSDERKEG